MRDGERTENGTGTGQALMTPTSLSLSVSHKCLLTTPDVYIATPISLSFV